MAAKHVTRGCLAAALVALVSAAAWAQPGGARIGARDVVTVSVFGVNMLSGKFPVDADGSINYPLIGVVPAAGQTTRELETSIGTRLKDGGFFTVVPQITVELEQTTNKQVTVTGAVRNAGVIRYAGELTVLDALVRAGSPSTEAGDEVLVVRAASDPAAPADTGLDGAGSVVSVNLRELQGGNVAAHNIVLHDGDLVIVQKALSVFISGYVRSSGAYRIESGTTVLQALALAGGLNERGTTRGLRILRNKEYVEDVTLDTVVEPGDTIIVRASPW